jgi:hypothetical protein
VVGDHLVAELFYGVAAAILFRKVSEIHFGNAPLCGFHHERLIRALHIGAGGVSFTAHAGWCVGINSVLPDPLGVTLTAIGLPRALRSHAALRHATGAERSDRSGVENDPLCSHSALLHFIFNEWRLN